MFLDGRRRCMKSIPIISGSKYTLITVSSSATTERKEVIVESVSDNPEFLPRYNGAHCGNHRIGTYKTDGEHEQYHLDIDILGTLVVPGWDSEVMCNRGKHGSGATSASMNNFATPDAISDILRRNLNPHFARYEFIVTNPKPLDTDAKESGITVFPDSPESHAVI